MANTVFISRFWILDWALELYLWNALLYSGQVSLRETVTHGDVSCNLINNDEVQMNTIRRGCRDVIKDSLKSWRRWMLIHLLPVHTPSTYTWKREVVGIWLQAWGFKLTFSKMIQLNQRSSTWKDCSMLKLPYLITIVGLPLPAS